ncbi:MAG: acyltransferase family protein [Lachnospiraceae bacterium]|nr:acyltransferase family protein [Lachnospiraceae bacterium]
MNRNAENRGRDFGADAVRIAALFMVLWVHFFLRNGFYYSKVTDAGGFFTVMWRIVCMCCVPLFLMLTGYLKCGKPWDRNYYRSLLPVLCTYVLVSAIQLLYKTLILKEAASAGEWFLSLLRFELANYSWYIGMYLGLFLVSPVLNLAWRACADRRAHRGLVLTMICVTFLPATVNGTVLGNLMPEYFSSLYYATWYVIGAYIRTYQPRPRRRHLALLLLAGSALLACANIATRTEPDRFYSGMNVWYNGLIPGAMATAAFLLLYQFESENRIVQRAAAFVSDMVLELYLLSYIADSRIYVLFYGEYPLCAFLPVGILMTAAVFLLTFLPAMGVNRLSRWICGRRKGAGIGQG